MKKGKTERWLTREGLLRLGAWARDGESEEAIARKMEISPAALRSLRKKYAEIDEALSKTREIADIEVENALHSVAVGGNVTAILFWLKSRKGKIWSDKPKNDEDKEKILQALAEANKEAAELVMSEDTEDEF